MILIKQTCVFYEHDAFPPGFPELVATLSGLVQSSSGQPRGSSGGSPELTGATRRLAKAPTN
eukprot:13144092-Alexandrium_andersonii.AAC.1